MKLTRIIIKFFTFCYYLLKLKNFRVAYLFSHYHVKPENIKTVTASNGKIQFNHTGNELPTAVLPSFRLGLNTLIRVLNNHQVKVDSSSEHNFIAKIGSLRLQINSTSNVATLDEIFIKTLYGFTSNDSGIVILDIGMNVGFASLYFASLDAIDTVYGFEPFRSTFDEAISNFDLNSRIRNKILPFDFGISNYTGDIDVPLLESGSAVSSTNDLFILTNLGNASSLNKMTVHIENITAVLDDIFNRHVGQPVYLKIDCEGEEYNILKELDQTGQLQKIKALLLEWHIKGPEEIVNRLKNHQFTILSFPIVEEYDKDRCMAGMLYAFK